MNPERRSPPIILLCFCGLLLIAVIVLGTWVLASHLLDRAIAIAERESSNLTLVLAEQTDHAFQSMELAQTSVVERIRGLRLDSLDAFERSISGHDIHLMLKDKIGGLPHVSGIAIFDPRGKIVNFSRSWPAPEFDIMHRDFFQAMQSDPKLTSFVGAPLRNRGTGTWVISLARRVSGPNNEPLGFVVGIMELEYFEKLFHAIALEPGSSMALFRRDGILLARHPRVDSLIGRSFGANALSLRLVQATGRGVGRMAGIIDGEDRIIAAHAVRHYPIVVTATRALNAVRSEWRRQAWLLLGAGFLAAFIVGVVIWMVARRLLQEHRVSEQTLLEQKRQLEAALDNIFQGLCFFDGAQKLIVCNQRYLEMYGLSPERVRPGISLREIIELRYAAGSGIAAMSLEAYHSWLSSLSAAGAPHDTIVELTNGKTLEVHQRPMADGGWVATIADITERRRTEAKILHLAHHDALTNLPNRELLHKRLEKACEHTENRAVAVLCLDLDRFKEVNDTLGHATGDLLLKEVAGRLSACLRQDDTLARMGGDEFAILQANASQPRSATALADRVIETLTAPFEVNGHQMLIGTSVGIAVAPGDGTDAGELLKKADLALYQVKGTGRGHYRFFEPGMDALMHARRQLEGELRQAVAAGAFELYFQPIVDMDGGRVTECEALVRWRHPTRGIITPDHFIPLAEEIGLVSAIGEWVLHAACTQATAWPDGIGVAVNLSPAQFKQGSLAQVVAQVLAVSCLSPDRLVLEITESILLENTDEVLTILTSLRELGVRIAMDDFGIGFSSLSSLSRFPFSKIKIDKSFVAGLGHNEHSAAIIEAVAALGARLDIRTTAEGVETPDQLAWLRAIGVSEVQGYLISRPQPAADVGKMISAAAMKMRAA
jgi:diguanylate cyclase (GGDEF)-like protein